MLAYPEHAAECSGWRSKGRALIQHYFAYGLSIASDLDLPGLNRGTSTEPDILITVPPKPVCVYCPDTVESMEIDTHQTRLCCPEAMFDIREGRDVVVTPTARFDPYTVGLMLVGPVLATVLHQRGYLVLHASAVSHHTCPADVSR
jgi:hypothetical protein